MSAKGSSKSRKSSVQGAGATRTPRRTKALGTSKKKEKKPKEREPRVDAQEPYDAAVRQAHEPGVLLLGMDEAGRGPLAGPVVVCCLAYLVEPPEQWAVDARGSAASAVAEASNPRTAASVKELGPTLQESKDASTPRVKAPGPVQLAKAGHVTKQATVASPSTSAATQEAGTRDPGTAGRRKLSADLGGCIPPSRLSASSKEGSPASASSSSAGSTSAATSGSLDPGVAESADVPAQTSLSKAAVCVIPGKPSAAKAADVASSQPAASVAAASVAAASVAPSGHEDAHTLLGVKRGLWADDTLRGWRRPRVRNSKWMDKAWLAWAYEELNRGQQSGHLAFEVEFVHESLCERPNNILTQTLLAMERAAARLTRRLEERAHCAPGTLKVCGLVDGPKVTDSLRAWAEPLVRGDCLSRTVASASIVAKVTRDRYLVQMVHKHPELARYGMPKNAAYGSPQHLAALQRYGPTPWHRLTFGKVRELLPLYPEVVQQRSRLMATLDLAAYARDPWSLVSDDKTKPDT